MAEKKVYYSVPEVAKRLRLSKPRIHAKIKQGHFPSTHWCTCGEQRFIDINDLRVEPFDKRHIGQTQRTDHFRVKPLKALEDRMFLSPGALARLYKLRNWDVINKIKNGGVPWILCECGKSRLIARKDWEKIRSR